MALDEQDKRWISDHIQKVEHRLTQRLHETETKLLGAFFGYQEHWEVRFRRISADVSNINSASELRINNLEQRVIELEKRLLLGGPPPAR